MTPQIKSNLVLLIPMVLLALLIYSIHYLLFGSLQATISGVVLSVAYVPIGVVYETLVIQKLLDKREEIKIEKKMNIIKGSFYHEIGTKLLFEILKGDSNIYNIIDYTNVVKEWTSEDFNNLKRILSTHTCEINIDKVDVILISEFLEENDSTLLNLIISPVTEEYEEFCNLVMEVLHIRDELSTIYNCKGENIQIDRIHITDDLCRLYELLLVQWGDYMHHLHQFYPSLFIKAVSTSPFNCILELKK